MATKNDRILKLEATAVHHLVDRVYREGGPYQWVREVLFNSLEAGAKRVEFGLEWQAVEAKGAYRRLIADDGKGMEPDDLVSFFRSFGGGGKPIGGVHENYGVGSKTSLLPWNPCGVVIVSWVGGVPSMVWLMRDSRTGEYGLRTFESRDPQTGEISQESVVEPFVDEEYGCDWATVGPDWTREHGTVIVLLGKESGSHSVEGDPGRPESDIKGISSYLNRRMWEFPEGVDVQVEELMSTKRSQWPRKKSERGARKTMMGTNSRRIRGAKHFVEYTAFDDGALDASGTTVLQDGTEVDWFLWKGDRPGVQSYAAISGYTAVQYRNELYEVSDHSSRYRSFGITEASVRKKVTLVVRPPEFCERTGRLGIYPRTDRNGLLIQGGPFAGKPLPLHDWAAAFCERMPEELMDAIREARSGGNESVTDAKWRDRLAERFGKLWRLVRLCVREGGTESVLPVKAGARSRKRESPTGTGAGAGGEGGTGGEKSIGTESGPKPAARRRVAGGIPIYRKVRAAELEDDGNFLAVWQPNDPDHPEGVVLLNIEHPVLEGEIRRWQEAYPPSRADEVKDEVLAVYGELAVSKVAHSEHLTSILPREVVDNELRCGASLTMSLLGLMGAESLLTSRLSGRIGRKAC